MSSKQYKLFKVFADNLKKTLSDNKLTIRSDSTELPDELYLCPISLNYFSEISLSNGNLTLEHVPPNSLGGKPLILTCKNVNNTDGASSDKKMLNFFKTRLFINNKGKLPARLSSVDRDFQGITSEISIDTTGSPKIHFLTSAKNLKALEHKKLFELWDGTQFKFSIQLRKQVEKRTLLKCAYLMAFSKIGYNLFLSSKGYSQSTYGILGKVLRSEITPEEYPIPYLNEHSPKNTPQIGLISEPKEYRSLYVNLEFILDGNTFKYVVFLPHPLENNLNSLRNMEKLTITGNNGEKLDLKITPIIDKYFVLNKYK